MSITLDKQDYRALQALRRSNFADRVKSILERQLEVARDEFELTSPANEELRARVREIKTAYNTLFITPIAQEG